MGKKEFICGIIGKEWNMFTNVQNIGQRASCQDDWPTFCIMRTSQFDAWNEETLACYMADLDLAISEGRNIAAEKYGFMMEYTDPEGYAAISGQLPSVTEEKIVLVGEILDAFLEQTEIFFTAYPGFSSTSRPLYRTDDQIFTSIETYTMGELKTYSTSTLKAYLAHIRALEEQGISIVYTIYENTARLYGYSNISEAEKSIAS